MNMKASTALTLFLALLAAAAVLTIAMSKTPMVWHAASSTGKAYWVKNAPGKDLVANRLADLELALKKLVREASVIVPDDPRLDRLMRKWDGTVAEVERPGDIAYSLNKKTIYVCVRNAAGGLEPYNTTMYVFLHEVAHVMTVEWGHTDGYWDNFRWLLELAEHLGLYTYEDFDALPITHCGHRLGNNAMGCVRKKECSSLLYTKKPRDM